MTSTAALLALLWTAAAGATPPDALLAELAPLRSQRVAEAPMPPEAAYARALSGEIVTGLAHGAGNKTAKLWGLVVFNHPVETVWMAVNDHRQYPDRMAVSESHLVGGEWNRDGRLIFEYLPAPFPVSDRWWVLRIHQNGELYEASEGRMWEMAWTTVDGPPAIEGTPARAIADGGSEIAWAKGGWLLVPLDDGRTLGEYFTWTDPGGMVPASLTSKLGAGELRKTFRAINAMASEYTSADRAEFVRPDQLPIEP